MRGEPIEAMRLGINALVAELKEDPQALETVGLSVITFGSEAKQVVPLTDLVSFSEVPVIEVCGKRDLGRALELLQACLTREFQVSTTAAKGDWIPIVLLLIDGPATDEWQAQLEQVRRCFSCRLNVVLLGSGSDESEFRALGLNVSSVNNLQPESLRGLIKWVSPELPKPGGAAPASATTPVQPGRGALKLATLSDGATLEYLPDSIIGEGGGKRCHFSSDKKWVLAFFFAPEHERLARLNALATKYNPTSDPVTGPYFAKMFCWPKATIVLPSPGVVFPPYPSNFFFCQGPWQGKAKEPMWFFGRTGTGRLFRELLPPEERGTLAEWLRICTRLAKAVKRLHHAGLAHADLSPRGVLVDPASGQCILINLEEVVVPGFAPPDFLIMPGYMAPELVATWNRPFNDPNRKHPSVATDQHALSVLIYLFLLLRHPLRGPKVNSYESAEEDDLLSMGDKALFIEHPTDDSNRPKDLEYTADCLGPHLDALFERAFIEGLHAPNRRPLAMEWILATLRTFDLIHPCPNASCSQKWFVVHDKAIRKCPFCRADIGSPLIQLRLKKEVRPGTWFEDGRVTMYHGLPIYDWHVYDNISPDETREGPGKESLAECRLVQGEYLLVNRKLASLTSPSGNRVAPGNAIALKHGMQFRFSQEEHGRIAEVNVLAG